MTWALVSGRGRGSSSSWKIGAPHVSVCETPIAFSGIGASHQNAPTLLRPCEDRTAPLNLSDAGNLAGFRQINVQSWGNSAFRATFPQVAKFRSSTLYVTLAPRSRNGTKHAQVRPPFVAHTPARRCPFATRQAAHSDCGDADGIDELKPMDRIRLCV